MFLRKCKWASLFVFLTTACIARKEQTALFGFSKNTKNHLLVLFGGSVQGYVEPCGCTSEPLGGLARLAAVVQEGRAHFERRVLFLDAGDLLFESIQSRTPDLLCQDEARVDLLLSAYRSFGLRISLEGQRDLARGEAWYRQMLAKHHIRSLRHLEQYSLRAETFSIAVIGLSKEEASTRTALEKQATLAKESHHLVFVLSQLSKKQLHNVVRDLSKVDFVIQGKDPSEQPISPERAGTRGPWILFPVMQGQYVGALEIDLNGFQKGDAVHLDDRMLQQEQRKKLLGLRKERLNKQIEQEKRPERGQFLRSLLQRVETELSSFKGSLPPFHHPHARVRLLPLPRHIPPEPTMHQAWQNYESQIPTLNARCEAVLECPKASPEQAFYVGAQTCKQCHAQAYDVWKNAVFWMQGQDAKGQPIKRQEGHSNAWHTLEKAHKTADRSCVGCHSVGFLEPGGFCKISEAGPFENVQCESCHGPGSKHVKTGKKQWIKRQVPEETCRTCHHPPHIQTTESFVYKEKLQSILGPGHGESLLKQLQHK